MPEKSKELKPPESITQTRSAIELAKNHPFEFGFRHAIQSEKVEFYIDQDQWMMKLPASNINDEVWSGNCAHDVLLTSAFLKAHAHPSATITIQELRTEGMGNSETNTDHYRVMVEQNSPPFSVIDTIDHSPFHIAYLSPADPKVSYWADLSEDELPDLEKESSVIDREASHVAYCEFSYKDKPGMSYTYFENLPDENVFKIGFDLVMPGEDEGDTNWNISFPIKYGFIDKDALIKMIDENPFFDKSDADTPHTSLKQMTKQWFKEFITALPDIVKKPTDDPNQNSANLTRYAR